MVLFGDRVLFSHLLPAPARGLVVDIFSFSFSLSFLLSFLLPYCVLSLIFPCSAILSCKLGSYRKYPVLYLQVKLSALNGFLGVYPNQSVDSSLLHLSNTTFTDSGRRQWVSLTAGCLYERSDHLSRLIDRLPAGLGYLDRCYFLIDTTIYI